MLLLDASPARSGRACLAGTIVLQKSRITATLVDLWSRLHSIG
jgi:hypothetical protein